MTNFLFVIITIFLSALFSGMEIAFVSSNKLGLEVEKKKHTFTSYIFRLLTNKPSRFITTMLIGNNISLVIYGIFMALISKPFIELIISSEYWIFFYQTIISTIIILITAEFLPKILFRINPNLVLKVFAIPTFFFYLLFYPITSFSIRITNFILNKVLNVKLKNLPSNDFGKIDLNNFIDTVEENKNNKEKIEYDVRIFKKALQFNEIKIRECTIPRPEVIALEENESIETLKQKFIETGLSKILIYEDSIDNIIGFVSSFKLFHHPENIKAITQKIDIITETMPANTALSKFIKGNKEIALVVDEFGGTAGIVTIEDIVEEIIGEVRDEHDSIELEEKQISKQEYIFSGRIEIDYLNEKYHLHIPRSEEYETIAGYILHHYKSIPKPNELINISLFKFQILKVSNIRIHLVKLVIDT